MHINRKPGEQVEVDWAGDPATIIDPDTGKIIKAYIFVGVMTYSQYAYVEAFLDMKQKSWINAPQYRVGFLRRPLCRYRKQRMVAKGEQKVQSSSQTSNAEVPLSRFG